MELKTEVFSNGSKWAGSPPDSVEVLLDVLQKHALDRSFEQTPFVTRKGSDVIFRGNFFLVSHVFYIKTNDPAVSLPLESAIRTNMERADYKSQDTERKWNSPDDPAWCRHIRAARAAKSRGRVA